MRRSVTKSEVISPQLVREIRRKANTNHGKQKALESWKAGIRDGPLYLVEESKSANYGELLTTREELNNKEELLSKAEAGKRGRVFLLENMNILFLI